jgi:hypothetical protein
MTRQEQLAAIGMEIRNLNARIESAEQEDSLTFEAEWSLYRLQRTLDQLKGAGKVRRSAEINPTI